VGSPAGKYDAGDPAAGNVAYAWHTFYGAAGQHDGIEGVAVDCDGNVYVAALSPASWNGPDDEPPRHPYTGGNDLVVLKLDRDGKYLWHTFYGSAGNDYPQAIAADGRGGVYVAAMSYASWAGPESQGPSHRPPGRLTSHGPAARAHATARAPGASLPDTPVLGLP